MQNPPRKGSTPESNTSGGTVVPLIHKMQGAPPGKPKVRRRPTVAEIGPHAIDLRVGGRVRLARLLAGHTQAWLGEQVGLSFQQIQKYERGTNRMSCSVLAEFARALKRPVSWFFITDEANTAPPPLSSEAIDRQRLTYELVVCFNRLANERVREHLVQIVRSVAETEDADI